jgi:hypothetical protein
VFPENTGIEIDLNVVSDRLPHARSQGFGVQSIGELAER